MDYVAYHPHAARLLGLIPSFLLESDPRKAREQINERYAHGGGWHPMPKWRFDRETKQLRYPGDPPLKPIASGSLHDSEMLYFYPHAWVCIVQPDGSFEVARLD